VASDLGLELVGTDYQLAAPTDDRLERMRARFITQLLSVSKQYRGSIFATELSAGRVRTNADVTGLFALTAVKIITYMRGWAADLAPIRAALNSFSFVSDTAIRLDFTIVSQAGSVQESVTVEAA